jgi:hypothetical protein
MGFPYCTYCWERRPERGIIHTQTSLKFVANPGLAGCTTHTGICLWCEHEHLVCRQPPNWAFHLPNSQRYEDPTTTTFTAPKCSSIARDLIGGREDVLHESPDNGRPGRHQGKRTGCGRFQMACEGRSSEGGQPAILGRCEEHACSAMRKIRGFERDV